MDPWPTWPSCGTIPGPTRPKDEWRRPNAFYLGKQGARVHSAQELAGFFKVNPS